MDPTVYFILYVFDGNTMLFFFCFVFVCLFLTIIITLPSSTTTVFFFFFNGTHRIERIWEWKPKKKNAWWIQDKTWRILRVFHLHLSPSLTFFLDREVIEENGDAVKKVGGNKIWKNAAVRSACPSRTRHCYFEASVAMGNSLPHSLSLSISNFYGNPLFPWLGELMTSSSSVFFLSATLNVYIMLAYRTASPPSQAEGHPHAQADGRLH